jgi:hypothetical protein
VTSASVALADCFFALLPIHPWFHESLGISGQFGAS